MESYINTKYILSWDSILPASSDLSRAAPGPQGDERPSEERRRGGWSAEDLANERRVLRVLTNERRVWRVLTNEEEC